MHYLFWLVIISVRTAFYLCILKIEFKYFPVALHLFPNIDDIEAIRGYYYKSFGHIIAFSNGEIVWGKELDVWDIFLLINFECACMDYPHGFHFEYCDCSSISNTNEEVIIEWQKFLSWLIRSDLLFKL